MAILRGVGEEETAANRATLSGSLSAYVRKGEVFTRPAPNVFGLVEFATKKTNGTPGPPPNFGTDDPEPEKEEGIPWLEGTPDEANSPE